MTQPPQPGSSWPPPQAAPQAAPYQQAGAPYPGAAPYPDQAYSAPAQPYAPPPGPPMQGQPMPGQPMPGQPMPGQPQGYPAPMGAPYPYGGPMGGVQCRFCGCVPAAEVTFRGHRGMIVLMQFLHVKGPFCRDCGLATFRGMTARSLVQGWYSYGSLLINPITVLINLVRRGVVAKLPAPMPPPSGEHGRPMDPGAPLLARPTALIGLAIPFVALLLLIVLAAASSSGG